MRILVTGGAGFIGGHLAERFLRDGHDVVVFDNLDPFYDVRIKERTIDTGEALAAEGDGTYRFVDGDVRDEDAVAAVVADAEYVVHHAALGGVRKSVDHPREYHAVNVEGTLNVLDACRQSDPERCVVASSSAVYGQPEALPMDEWHPTAPVSPYGASKLAAERYAIAYADVYGLAVVGLRYFTVYGPRMRPNMALTNFVSRCHHGEAPVVFADGTQTRDITHVDDVVSINAALLDSDAADGQVLNVGSAQSISIGSLAREIRDRIAPDLPIAFRTGQAGDLEHTLADVSRAADRLGYVPSVSIRDGVSRFVDWYLENQAWYDPLVRAS